MHANTISGFTPNSTSPDSNFGKCLQCAAIDRARFKVSPVISRSDFCSTCFKQYCFDPANPPSSSEIVGRKYAFVDPDPQGVSKVEGFLGEHKVPLIVGLVLLVLVIVAAVFGLCVFGVLICRQILIYLLCVAVGGKSEGTASTRDSPCKRRNPMRLGRPIATVLDPLNYLHASKCQSKLENLRV